MEEALNITALIIDDDPMSRKHLKSSLDKLGKVKVVQVCESGAEGIEAIKQLQPDLIFLDVEMPDMSGFDMLKRLTPFTQEVIFTTSFDQYAIRAIKFAALDYLLKPVQVHLLQEALDTAIEKIKSKRGPTQASQVSASVTQPVKTLDSLAIPTLEGLLFVEVGDIIWCESEGRYTNVCFAEKKPIMASRNLAEFEELLTPAGFIRVHKSHLINLKHVKRYIRGEGGQVIMANGKALDVGRSFKQKLLEKIEQFR